MMKNGSIEAILRDESLTSSPNTQKLLINGLSRFPDLFSSKRGRLVSDEFLPINYYRRLASCMFKSLESIHSMSLNGRYLTKIVYVLGVVNFNRFCIWGKLCAEKILNFDSLIR